MAPLGFDGFAEVVGVGTDNGCTECGIRRRHEPIVAINKCTNYIDCWSRQSLEMNNLVRYFTKEDSLFVPKTSTER